MEQITAQTGDEALFSDRQEEQEGQENCGDHAELRARVRQVNDQSRTNVVFKECL